MVITGALAIVQSLQTLLDIMNIIHRQDIVILNYVQIIVTTSFGHVEKIRHGGKISFHNTRYDVHAHCRSCRLTSSNDRTLPFVDLIFGLTTILIQNYI